MKVSDVYAVKQASKSSFLKEWGSQASPFARKLFVCVCAGSLVGVPLYALAQTDDVPVSSQALSSPADGSGVVHVINSTAIQDVVPVSQPPAPTIARSPLEAFENARISYHSGQKQDAVLSLQYAAGQGHTGAQWMLGRMYAEGDGVNHDDKKAFDYFYEIIRQSSDDPESYEAHRNAPYISSALVWLGSYYLEGIAGTSVNSQPNLALRLFSDAAYNYGDPNAQYNLARMYLDGNGVRKDPSQAIKWLNLAAQKNHIPSQALLGHILFTGQGVPRQPAKGLGLMALARQKIEQQSDAKETWVIDLHNKALEQASREEQEKSVISLERWLEVER